MTKEKIARICSIENCGQRHEGLGFCQKHWRRYKLYGDPLQCHPIMGYGDDDASRFWSRVNKNGATMPHMSTACWEWVGKLTASGYVQVQIKGKRWPGHKYAYFLTYGVESHLFILHECDNPKCVNPEHLREGTTQENAQDAVARNRMSCGESRPLAKLTDDKVRELRQYKNWTITALAQKYQVDRKTLRQALRGQTWKHVT